MEVVIYRKVPMEILVHEFYIHDSVLELATDGNNADGVPVKDTVLPR